MRALDLFCGAGGAGMGLHRAGFEVTGVDIEIQRSYPFIMYVADALDFPLEGYDLIWASPPCQRWSAITPDPDSHPDLITPIRERLLATGLPYIIENVPQAPLRRPMMLCGTMFGLYTYRHRHFETNMLIPSPVHPKHQNPVARIGTAPKEGEFMSVVGNFVGVENGRRAMGIEWMSRSELVDAVPPAYAEYLGKHAKAWIERATHKASA